MNNEKDSMFRYPKFSFIRLWENCNEWYSLSGINHKHRIEDTEFGVKTSCGQCGYVSYWNLEIAPVAILCNDSGIPYQDVIMATSTQEGLQNVKI